MPLLPWQSGAPPEGEVFVVGSMTQLAHYAYTDYQMRIDTLRAAALQKHKVTHNASMGAEAPLLSGIYITVSLQKPVVDCATLTWVAKFS